MAWQRIMQLRLWHINVREKQRGNQEWKIQRSQVHAMSLPPLQSTGGEDVPKIFWCRNRNGHHNTKLQLLTFSWLIVYIEKQMESFLKNWEKYQALNYQHIYPSKFLNYIRQYFSLERFICNITGGWCDLKRQKRCLKKYSSKCWMSRIVQYSWNLPPVWIFQIKNIFLMIYISASGAGLAYSSGTYEFTPGF